MRRLPDRIRRELILKMPDSSRLVDRRNCMILDDARDVQSLEAGLAWVFENPIALHRGSESTVICR